VARVFPRHLSRLRTRLAAVVLAPALAVGLSAPIESAHAGSCGRASGCNRYELIHAGSTYSWYPAAIRHEFITADGARPPAAWSYAGTPTAWSDKYGTLLVEQHTGDVFTDWNQSRRAGRWEVRFRSKSGTARTPAGLTPYQVKVELVPDGTAPTRCAAESVLMTGYDPATAGRTARVGVTRPGFRAMATATPVGPLFDVNSWNPTQDEHYGAWRVWAVEVGRDHISWFLDGKVIRRESRPAALIGKRLHLRLSLLSTPGAEMAPAITQLDWARYWTLKRTTKVRKKVRALRRAPGLTAVATSPAPGC
jgi:hypothetical protein